jgi:hypothetical protein
LKGILMVQRTALITGVTGQDGGIGDATKSRQNLGWQPTTRFDALVAERGYRRILTLSDTRQGASQNQLTGLPLVSQGPADVFEKLAIIEARALMAHQMPPEG